MKALRVVMLPIALLLASSVAFAESDDKKSSEDWADFSAMMTERSKMLRSTMMMSRETMKIVMEMNHHPSAADKEKLSKMIEEVDALMEHESEISKKMMKKWKKEDWGDKHKDWGDKK